MTRFKLPRMAILQKMNLALSGGAITGGMVGSDVGRGMRDRFVNALVTVR
jgi:hypothetical protein